MSESDWEIAERICREERGELDDGPYYADRDVDIALVAAGRKAERETHKLCFQCWEGLCSSCQDRLASKEDGDG